ncbi:glycosyltransferase [Algibacter mikhailovii]|uniref:glycosyltransferase n=1 Tax=Algibacter mikhailovii TaxID=425498 RepID=UPI002493D4E1|nr:glycosyltransferase [Algibacter mikhailovii]
MMIFGICITLLYLIAIGFFVYGFDKIKLFHLNDLPSKTKFSIVIPFRNEAEHLPKLLQSLQALEYPNHFFEVILLDDASEDHSAEIINNFMVDSNLTFKILPNTRQTGSPKKDAISLGIKNSNYDWIITTDADCVLPKYWLNSYDEFIQQRDASCIAAPVSYIQEGTFLKQFQLLNHLSLQGATIGGFGINKPFMSNGANFAYRKALFNELKGFKGNDNIASGDDIFLLAKMVKANNKQVQYLKCNHAIVSTTGQPTWGRLVSQHVRWASKTKAYNSFGKAMGSIVFFMNTYITLAFLLLLTTSIDLKIFAYILFIKFNIDFLIIFKSARFFNQQRVLKTYPLGFLIYPFFSAFIALKSLFFGYAWKGRTFKN